VAWARSADCGSWYGIVVDDIVSPWCLAGARRARAWPRALLALAAFGIGVSDAWSADVADPVPPRSDVDVSLFASPTTHDHIGRVVVPVKINGRGPFRFIVDTGANHSTISPGLVQALGLKTNTTSPMTLDGITGSAKVSYVSIDQLQAGALTIERTALPVVWAPVMGGADGILGAAGLEDKSLLIDFRRNSVSIASSVDSRARADTTKIHALRVVNGGLLVVEARVGGVYADAVLDTGAERTLGNLALHDALKLHDRGGRGFVAQVTSVYGATTQIEPGEIQRAPPIAIETVQITDVAVVFGDFHIFKVWEMRARPAIIIGMDVLGTVAALHMDFRNRDVYVGSNPAGSGRDALQQLHNSLSEQAMKK
jgi:predicted aspartyl protease